MMTNNRWLGGVLAVVLALGLAMPALAQGEGEITLVPFTSENFGIEGVVPEGWSEPSPGVYARGAGMGDLTSLIQQAAPDMTTEQLITALLPNLGLSKLPEPVGTLETEHFTWTRYDVSVSVSGLTIKVAMALAEDETGVKLVLLQALEEDFDALYESVFLPAVEALAPLGSAATGAGEQAIYTDPEGRFTVPIPTNWAAEDRPGYAYLYAPEELITVSIVVVPETDPETALAAAWQVVDPTFDREVKDTIELPAGNLDRFFLFNYKMERDEKFIYQVETRTLGDLTYVLIFYADLTAAQQRAAQIQIVDSGFKITALEEVDLSGVEPLPLTDDLLSELEAYIQDAMARFETPGAAVAIVQDGEIAYTGGFGVRNPAGDPVTPDTRMLIGSTTKTMTTLLMAQMVDEGRMTWDTPATALLPSFRVADPEVTERITVENLVCACTGVPRRDFEILFNSAEMTAERMIETLADFEFFTDFGEAFQYSNQMVAAGGYIAALAGGGEYGSLYDDYVRLMEERIFQPLGMASTTFSFEEVLASDDYATPYSLNFALETVPADMAIEKAILIPITPAGAAWSTVRDMARYMIMQMAGGVTADGTRIVSAENLAHTQQPQIAINAESSYGLGWIISHYKGQTVLSHAGNTIGFTSEFLFLPEAGVGIVILSNQQGSLLNSAVSAHFLELIFDQPPEAEESLTFALEQLRRSRQETFSKVHEIAEPEALAIAPGIYTNPALGEITLSLNEAGVLVLDCGEFQTTLWQYIDPEQQEAGEYSFLMMDAPLAGTPLTFEPVEGSGYTLKLGGGVTEYVFEQVG